MPEDAAVTEGSSSEAQPVRYVGIGNPLVQLPPEIRNEIYELVLGLDREHEPVVEGFKFRGPGGIYGPARRNNNFELLCVDMLINLEAYSLMACKTPIYIPIHSSINYHPDPVSKNENTISRALKEFMNVHFHIQLDYALEDGELYISDPNEHGIDMRKKIDELFDVLKLYLSSSQAVSKRQGWRRRSATVHLNHLLCEFGRDTPLLYISYSPGALQDLVTLMSEDINTNWEIRFYVFTEEDKFLGDIHHDYFEADLALLEAYCSKYEHITVKAEVYGSEEWKMENESANVIRVEGPRDTLVQTCNETD